MKNSLRLHLADTLDDRIEQIHPVRGGDISSAVCVETSSQKYFVKYNSTKFLGNFLSEANGLNALRAKSRLAIPLVINVGTHAENAYLILNYIDADRSSQTVHGELGRGLAELHKNTQAYFGYERDNYIGSLNQSNTLTADWPSFYGQERLTPLFRKGYDMNMFNSRDEHHLSSLILRLEEVCPNERPSLIHGDLWSGNWMSSGDQPYLIDPSVSFAHRELDLAMSQLFGGFDPLFYETYHELYPLEPLFSQRVDIYQLYYLLVHAVLFHGGYIQSVKQILQNYGS